MGICGILGRIGSASFLVLLVYTIILSFLFSSVVFAGSCAVNQHGRVVCADTPGGGCAVNQHGRVVCN